MKFPEKTSPMVTLMTAKKQDFILSLVDAFLEKIEQLNHQMAFCS